MKQFLSYPRHKQLMRKAKEKRETDSYISVSYTHLDVYKRQLKYGDGIRVNAIAPGFFIGDQNRRVLINPDGSLTDRSRCV